MTNRVKLISKKEYSFNEMGEFIFAQAWENSKSSGINIGLVESMRKELSAEWNADTDSFTIVVIEGLRNIRFTGDEIREMYKVIPIF